MAGIYNAITQGQLSRTIKALLGNSESEGGIERFSETLQPVIDPFSSRLPEAGILRNERLFGTVITTAVAPAGRNAVIKFGFPAGAGDHLLVIRAFAFDQDVEVMIGPNVDPSNLVTESAYPVDVRNLRKPAVVVVSGDSTLAAMMTRPSWRTFAIPAQAEFWPWILTGASGAGGVMLNFAAVTVATALKAAILFTERPINVAEQKL